MRHIFVETNWVVGYASPAHHKDRSAVRLLERAREGELKLHLPAVCVTEARRPIQTKCQPRHEADAIREFLLWAHSSGLISAEAESATRSVLDRFESQVRSELKQLGAVLGALGDESALEVFPLSQTMLELSVELSSLDLQLKPFDQAILAGILVRADELWRSSEQDLSFSEIDSDLQPWDSMGRRKPLLADLFDQHRLWVYSDFELTFPERPAGRPHKS